MPTPDPWAWSLDSCLALSGVVVSAVGAIATIVVATLALVATKRANRLEAEGRERAGRVQLSSAIDAYLTVWGRDPHNYNARIRRESVESLAATAAGVSSNAETVATWVPNTLTNYMDQMVEDHTGFDTATGDRLMAIAADGATAEIRRRITTWVATGVLNQSRLVTPLSGPPLLNLE